MDQQELIDTLNDLIKTNKDGEYAFNACARDAKSVELRRTFVDCGADCRLAVTELQALVAQFGGQPDDSGSLTGALHRGWLTVRESMSGGSDRFLLEDCDRGEITAIERYQEALQGTALSDEALPAPVRMTLEKQLQATQHHHERIKSLGARLSQTSTDV